MGKISVRMSDERKGALQALKDEYGMTITDIINDAVRVWLKMHDESLPDHLEKDTRHEDIVDRNRHRMRRMRFKQRVHDTLVGLLEDERGNPKKFPPEPDKVEDEYFQSLREEVEREYEKYHDEYMDFLDEELRWYSLQHPNHNPAEGKSLEECVRLVAEQIEHGRRDYAKSLAAKMRDQGELPEQVTTNRLMEKAEELREKENWRNEWDQAMKGRKEEEA